MRALAGPPKFFGLAVLRSGEILGATFAAGVVRSGIDTWSAVPELSELSTNAVLQTTSGAVLVGTNGNGLHRSPDGGRSWQRVAAGPAGTVYSLAQGQSLYAGTADEGVWRSMDDGATWTPVDAAGRSGTCHATRVTARRDGTVVARNRMSRRGVTVHALADDGSAIYAGCNGHGVLRSSDGCTLGRCVGRPRRSPRALPARHRRRAARRHRARRVHHTRRRCRPGRPPTPAWERRGSSRWPPPPTGRCSPAATTACGARRMARRGPQSPPA